MSKKEYLGGTARGLRRALLKHDRAELEKALKTTIGVNVVGVEEMCDVLWITVGGVHLVKLGTNWRECAGKLVELLPGIKLPPYLIMFGRSVAGRVFHAKEIADDWQAFKDEEEVRSTNMRLTTFLDETGEAVLTITFSGKLLTPDGRPFTLA